MAFLPHGLLKVQPSIEGGVYQRAAFIRGNTVNGNLATEHPIGNDDVKLQNTL